MAFSIRHNVKGEKILENIQEKTFSREIMIKHYFIGSQRCSIQCLYGSGRQPFDARLASTQTSSLSAVLASLF